MGTAINFSDTEDGTATPAGTLLPADVEMQAHCNQCRITASTAYSQHPHSGTQQGALQPLPEHCIQPHGHCILRHNILHEPSGHCIHCMGTAFTFRDTKGGTATPARTLLPADVEMQAHCNHCRITGSTACSHYPHSGTQQGALQPLLDNCIHLHGH